MKPDRDLLATVTRNRKCGDPHCHAGLSRIADASSDGCYRTVGDVRSRARARKLAICARVTTFPGQKRGGSVAQPAAMLAAARASILASWVMPAASEYPADPTDSRSNARTRKAAIFPRVTALSGQKRGGSAAHPAVMPRSARRSAYGDYHSHQPPTMRHGDVGFSRRIGIRNRPIPPHATSSTRTALAREHPMRTAVLSVLPVAENPPRRPVRPASWT